MAEKLFLTLVHSRHKTSGMDITPALKQNIHLVQSYGAGRLVVRDQAITEHMLLWPEGVKAMGHGELDTISPTEITNAIHPLPELLLVGTGPSITPIPAALKRWLKQHQVACEPMDTGAACRTYNVLVAEDRRIAALLLVV